ncbi:MAG: O-methyltransferase [Kordiimonas sp.]
MNMQSAQHMADSDQTTLKAIQQRTVELGFDMASELAVGSLVRSLIASKPGGTMLELGTGTGLSTFWMLAGLTDDAKLVSVDNDAAVQAVAKEYLGSDKRLQLICADGADFIRAAQSGSYDLIFADAWPGKYSELDETLALLKSGGIYFVDDLLPQENWPAGHQANVDAFIIDMQAREGFHVTVLDWASGLLMAVKA